MSTSNGHSNDDDDDDVVTVNGAGGAKDVAINGAASGKPFTISYTKVMREYTLQGPLANRRQKGLSTCLVTVTQTYLCSPIF